MNEADGEALLQLGLANMPRPILRGARPIEQRLANGMKRRAGGSCCDNLPLSCPVTNGDNARRDKQSPDLFNFFEQEIRNPPSFRCLGFGGICVSLFFPGTLASPFGRKLNATGIASALLVHAAVVAIIALGVGQSESLSRMAQPLAVRLVEAMRPEEKPPAPPPAPNKQAKAPSKVFKTPILAIAAPNASSSFAVAEQPPAVAAPVQVASPAPAPAAAAEPLVEARFDADYLANPKPPYPSASRRFGEAGTVYLRVQVSAEGHAHKVELKSSSGFARLDQSALDTVAQWRFVPARRGNTAVTAWVIVPIVFSLT